ncbi:hypothetical protein B0H11DRAFT_1937906 [Mycena galericulata]|nr:hypothetical protein B0H11DRAFT_1937906 [Mycena galericulata]
MDTTAVCRFMASNVVWPLDKFFIPAGGLAGFLRENLRFKIFLIMTSIFTDPFAGVTVSSLMQLEMNQVRARMRDVVSHVFFAAQIRQNEFRVAYSPIGVPAQAAWMFHMILTLLHVVGFEGDDITVVTNEVTEARMTEGQLAHEQVSSLLGGALATYVEETKLGIPAILDYKESLGARCLLRCPEITRISPGYPKCSDHFRGDFRALQIARKSQKEPRFARSGNP